MPYEVVDLECPGCGYQVTTNTKQCPQCYREIVITNFDSAVGMADEDARTYTNKYRKVLASHPKQPELNLTMAFCFLKMKLYDKALPHFEKAIEDDIDNPEAYFYAAVAMLHGKRPFLVQKSVICKIEEYISAAIEIEPKGIYYYFLAYIKKDFYEKKCFRTSPTSQEVMETAIEAGLSSQDTTKFWGFLSAERPAGL